MAAPRHYGMDITLAFIQIQIAFNIGIMASIKQLTILTCSIRWRKIQLKIKCKLISRLKRLHLDCVNVHMHTSHNIARARNTQFTTTFAVVVWASLGEWNEIKNEIEYVLAHAYRIALCTAFRITRKKEKKQTRRKTKQSNSSQCSGSAVRRWWLRLILIWFPPS